MSSRSGNPSESPSPKCALCSSHHLSLTTPTHWWNESAHKVLETLDISLDVLVCQPCKKDALRVARNPTIVPRWEKKKVSSCVVDNCPNEVFVSTKVMDRAQISTAVEYTKLSITGDIPFPTPLCKSHYHALYNTLKPTCTNCKACGVSLRSRQSRPCPKLDKLEANLRNSIEFEITETDRLCMTCYMRYTQETEKGS